MHLTFAICVITFFARKCHNTSKARTGHLKKSPGSSSIPPGPPPRRALSVYSFSPPCHLLDCVTTCLGEPTAVCRDSKERSCSVPAAWAVSSKMDERNRRTPSYSSAPHPAWLREQG